MPSGATKKTKWALSLAVLITITTLISVVIFFAIRSQNYNKNLTIKGHRLNIELAETEQEKRRGLCCRDYLPANSGMLFIYNKPGNYSFWMKDTRIPLDMIWIDSDKKIAHIEHSVQPESYPHTYNSPQPAQYILEVNSGWSKAHGIVVGDVVQL